MAKIKIVLVNNSLAQAPVSVGQENLKNVFEYSDYLARLNELSARNYEEFLIALNDDLFDGEFDSSLENIGIDTEAALVVAKASKIKEVKDNCDNNLNIKIPKTGSNFVLTVNGISREFILKKADVAILQGVIDSFNPLNLTETKEWTDIYGQRISMEKSDFKSLLNHYIDRDQLEHALCQNRINEINSLTSLYDVENYDINKVDFE